MEKQTILIQVQLKITTQDDFYFLGERNTKFLSPSILHWEQKKPNISAYVMQIKWHEI